MRRFGDQDLMMSMTMWGPGARGEIKITKPLRRPARVWNPILKQGFIEKLARDLNKCQGCRVLF